MSMCICKPWRGHHLPECPCQVAYERQREAELDAHPITDEEAEQQAATLVSEGWLQKSRKYRTVIKVPSGSKAITEVERINPAAADELRQEAGRRLEDLAKSYLWHHGQETKNLPLKVFEAFRRLSGRKGPFWR